MLESQSIEVPCPQCGKKAKKTIGWIKAHSEYTCAGCNNTVKLDRNKFLREIEKAEKSIRDLTKGFGR